MRPSGSLSSTPCPGRLRRLSGIVCSLVRLYQLTRPRPADNAGSGWLRKTLASASRHPPRPPPTLSGPPCYRPPKAGRVTIYGRYRTYLPPLAAGTEQVEDSVDMISTGDSISVGGDPIRSVGEGAGRSAPPARVRQSSGNGGVAARTTAEHHASRDLHPAAGHYSRPIYAPRILDQRDGQDTRLV